jgi:hypothetical protein
MFWFIAPLVTSIAAIVGAIFISRELALLAWPFFAAAIICGLGAWQLYDNDGAERSLLRATAATILSAVGLYTVVVPSLAPVFPAVALSDVLHGANCANPVAASSGFEEPSLVFLAGTATHLTDGSGAADFLHEGACRFAFIDSRQERSFALRAEAIGLRYDRGQRIEGFNISNGQWLNIAVFQSAGTP